jgi:hypothetical protein
MSKNLSFKDKDVEKMRKAKWVRLVEVLVFLDELQKLRNGLQKKKDGLVERLKKEPYPHTNTDCLILEAEIGLLDEVLERLDKLIGDKK